MVTIKTDLLETESARLMESTDCLRFESEVILILLDCTVTFSLFTFRKLVAMKLKAPTEQPLDRIVSDCFVERRPSISVAPNQLNHNYNRLDIISAIQSL